MSKPVCTIVGAGPGISLAVAERFAREGFQIALTELAPARIHVATITIDGVVQPNTPLAPDLIAEGYWRLHTQPRNQREREIVYRAAA